VIFGSGQYPQRVLESVRNDRRRVGYLCAPKELCEAILKIHQYVMLCAPVMGQVGALEAIRSAEEDKNNMVQEYRLRRICLLQD